MKQLTKINFKGQRIFVGIDVHLRSWTISIYMDDITLGTKSFPPSAKILGSFNIKESPVLFRDSAEWALAVKVFR